MAKVEAVLSTYTMTVVKESDTYLILYQYQYDALIALLEDQIKYDGFGLTEADEILGKLDFAFFQSHAAVKEKSIRSLFITLKIMIRDGHLSSKVARDILANLVDLDKSEADCSMIEDMVFRMMDNLL